MPPKRKARSTAARAEVVKRRRRSEELLESVVKVDSEGDVLLAIVDSVPIQTDEASIFLVDRKILSLCSPTFKAILAGNYATPRNHPLIWFNYEQVGHYSKITIQNDSIEAMELVLHIIHLQGHQVSEDISYPLLFELAALCKKYDLRRSLATWPRTWIKQWLMHSVESLNTDLFITYAFKLDSEFLEVTRKITVDSESPDGGRSLEVGGCLIGGFQQPQVIGEQTLAVGSATSDNMLETIVRWRQVAIECVEKILWRTQSSASNLKTACMFSDSAVTHAWVVNGQQYQYQNPFDQAGFCQIVQMGLYKKHLPYLERPHDGSSFRKMSLSSILADLARLKDDAPDYLGRHKSCLRGKDMHYCANNLIKEIKGVDLEETWYANHSEGVA